MRYLSHDNTKPIPVHRVAVVLPFAQVLTDIGASVERGFRQAGIPICALENANNYVPSHRFWTFLVNMANKEGIPDLGFRVGQTFGTDCPDPHLTDLLHRSTTLYQGILKASELTNKTITHCRLGLLQPPGSRYTYFFHSPSCDANNPAIAHIGWFGLMHLIGLVREFTGPQWQPNEIGLMMPDTPSRRIREQFARTRIRLSQPYSYIAFEKTLLSLPPLPYDAVVPLSPPLPYEPFASDFVGSLRQVLHSYLQERDLGIETAATLCETSKRTLQRKLKASDTYYSEVLNAVRYHAACAMLRERDIKVADIAHQLRYSHPTHFSRAFRRIAGISPRAYRQQYYRTADC